MRKLPEDLRYYQQMYRSDLRGLVLGKAKIKEIAAAMREEQKRTALRDRPRGEG